MVQQRGLARPEIQRHPVLRALPSTHTADTAAPFAAILDENAKQQAIAWAEQHTRETKRAMF
ncbi:MAG: hypothetical protein QM607_12115 [Microbacterium sp.]